MLSVAQHPLLTAEPVQLTAVPFFQLTKTKIIVNEKINVSLMKTKTKMESIKKRKRNEKIKTRTELKSV